MTYSLCQVVFNQAGNDHTLFLGEVYLVEYQMHIWYMGCQRISGNSCQYFAKVTFTRSFLDHPGVQWLTNSHVETF